MQGNLDGDNGKGLVRCHAGGGQRRVNASLRARTQPRTLGADRPARVRSWMSLRSNWASAEKMWKTSSPDVFRMIFMTA